jgi:hypothetical protein
MVPRLAARKEEPRSDELTIPERVIVILELMVVMAGI